MTPRRASRRCGSVSRIARVSARIFSSTSLATGGTVTTKPTNRRSRSPCCMRPFARTPRRASCGPRDWCAKACSPRTMPRRYTEVQAAFDRVLTQVKAAPAPAENGNGHHAAAPDLASVDTSVRPDVLRSVNDRLLVWPSDFKPLPKLAKLLERRRAALGEAGGIDWGHAEALALGSLLTQGVSVRLTGQDSERGTFSHRQAVLHDYERGASYAPLQHIPGAP